MNSSCRVHKSYSWIAFFWVCISYFYQFNVEIQDCFSWNFAFMKWKILFQCNSRFTYFHHLRPHHDMLNEQSTLCLSMFLLSIKIENILMIETVITHETQEFSLGGSFLISKSICYNIIYAQNSAFTSFEFLKEKHSTNSKRWLSIHNKGVFPKCFTEFSKFSDKNICHYSKRAQTCHFLCKRPGCYHSTSKRQVADTIFKLTPIHVSVIYHIPWIRWIHWISDLFTSRKNSNTLTILSVQLMSKKNNFLFSSKIDTDG